MRYRWDPSYPEYRRRPSTPYADIRASDAERAEVADRLSHHFADGRLDQPEFKARLDRAMGATTRGDLDGLCDDLPPPPARRLRRRAATAISSGPWCSWCWSPSSWDRPSPWPTLHGYRQSCWHFSCGVSSADITGGTSRSPRSTTIVGVRGLRPTPTDCRLNERPSTTTDPASGLGSPSDPRQHGSRPLLEADVRQNPPHPRVTAASGPRPNSGAPTRAPTNGTR